MLDTEFGIAERRLLQASEDQEKVTVNLIISNEENQPNKKKMDEEKETPKTQTQKTKTNKHNKNPTKPKLKN